MMNQMLRRHFLQSASLGLGTAALASLLQADQAAAEGIPGVLTKTHFPARAKRIIYLFMSGGPSHIDLFDYKPALRKHHGEELPATVRMGQRITGMTSGQSSFPCVAPMFQFNQYGSSGTCRPNWPMVGSDTALPPPGEAEP